VVAFATCFHFRVQAALQIPFGCEFLGAGFDFGDPVAFDGSRFSRALSFPMRSGSCLAKSLRSKFARYSLAIAKYAQDWDERLPPARRWVDAISERHLKRDDIPQIFRCPKSSSPFSYAFNISLDGVSILQVGYPSETVLLFDDASSLNAFGEWRHLEGDIYAFVDGHAKWIRRSNVNLRWKP
jgi:hypothetical protein